MQKNPIQLSLIRPAAEKRGTAGNDTLTGTRDADVLDGLGGDDSLSGGEGEDILLGADGNDTLLGGAGNDFYLIPGSGDDLVNGGAGFDRLFYDDGYGDDPAGPPQRGAVIDLVTGRATDPWGGQDTLSGIEYLSASLLDDAITGGENAHEFYGNAGNDTILAGSGNDGLYGGPGDDSLSGAGGGDTLLGLDGNDTLIGGNGNDLYLIPGSGSDLVTGGAGFDRLFYDDSYGEDPAGPPQQGAVIDLIAGRATDPWGGQDTLSGIEYVAGSALGDVISGGENAHDFHGNAGDDTIVGGSGNDGLTGGAGNDSLSGGGGGDTLVGADGNDTLAGGTGNDLYLLPGSGNDVVNGGGGYDRLYYDASFGDDPAGAPTRGAAIDMGPGTAIDPWGGRDTLAGIEEITGSPLGDRIVGGEQVHLITGLAGNDTLTGGNGADTLQGSEGDDRLSGGGKGDLLLGNAGDDTLLGGSGNDALHPGSGNDELNGGTGFDTVFYDSSYGEDLAGPPTGGLVIDLVAGTVTDGWGGRDTLSGIENVVGSGLDDVLQGNAADNDLEGGAGDDAISGGEGSDTASYHSAPSPVSVDLSVDGPQATGGAGTDTLAEIENIDGSNFGDTLAGNATANVINGGTGADLMSGGDGNDTYHVDNAFDEVFEAPDTIPAGTLPGALGLGQDPDPHGTGSGIDTVIAQLSYTLKANVENLVLAGNSALDGAGNALDNLLTGNAAANRLSGLDGRDLLDGGNGNDTLAGGAGADTLGGGGGNDLLSGGEGADALRGGGGADGFLFDAPLAEGTVDTVLDFNAGTDTLRLDDDVFTAFTAGTALTAGQLRAGAGISSADAPGQRLLYDTASGALYYDADGNGTASAPVRFAVLGSDTHPTLGVADVLIVG